MKWRIAFIFHYIAVGFFLLFKDCFLRCGHMTVNQSLNITTLLCKKPRGISTGFQFMRYTYRIHTFSITQPSAPLTLILTQGSNISRRNCPTFLQDPLPTLHGCSCASKTAARVNLVKGQNWLKTNWGLLVGWLVGCFLRLLWTQVSPRILFANHHSYKRMWQPRDGEQWVLAVVEKNGFIPSSS